MAEEDVYETFAREMKRVAVQPAGPRQIRSNPLLGMGYGATQAEETAPLGYAHECVDRPNLTCPACAASGQMYVIPLCGPDMDKAIPIPDVGSFENLTRRGSKGQSLVEVCAMLAVLLVLAVGARHVGMHIFKALREVVTVTRGTN